jgi:hypothetical protein
MQIQCHIVLYLPDYHVNTHRVCSTVRQLCKGWEIEALKFNVALLLNRSTNVEFCTSPQLLQNCSLAVRVFISSPIVLFVIQFFVRILSFVKNIVSDQRFKSVLLKFCGNLPSVICRMVGCVKKNVTNVVVKCLSFTV